MSFQGAETFRENLELIWKKIEDFGGGSTPQDSALAMCEQN